MKRRTVLALGGTALFGGGYLAYELFAPERATAVDDDRTGSDESGATVLKRGEFVGKANHRCSGMVELAEDDTGRFLQFRDYEQTQGPDVFCYLTPAEDPDTTTEIAAGTKVLIDGGADGGEITKTGSFVQQLPDDISFDDVNGVAIWCENFAVPFGAAALSTV